MDDLLSLKREKQNLIPKGTFLEAKLARCSSFNRHSKLI
jgi:hypothetical protein